MVIPAETPASRERAQSRGEEIANSVSHGVGLLAALVAAPVLMLSAVRNGGAARIAGASVFAVATVLLYLTSTLYHALPGNRAKQLFRLLDHASIYVMIAGTYTPITLSVLGGTWGWTMFGIVWGLALGGIVLTAAGGVRYPKLRTSLYLAMGWLILVAVKPLWLRMPSEGLLWLLGGGIAYMVGVVFYAAKRVRYCHFVWHLFVVAGTACHFVAVLRFAA
jgi:hemolysin III